jgi:uncharacterized surface protein with fasciclin (FAS1) repeats
MHSKLLTALPLLALTATAAHAQTAPAPAASSSQTTTAPARAGQMTAAPATASTPAATETIAQKAAATPALSTLTKAVTAADLGTTLSGPGPFTVFAPTDAAFGRLAPGTLDTLLKPENKATLTKVLTYHVVPGALDGIKLGEQVKAAGGTLTLTTVEGEPLTVSLVNGAAVLTDVNGNKSYIEQYDVKAANGVVHVVNGVLTPKLG